MVRTKHDICQILLIYCDMADSRKRIQNNYFVRNKNTRSCFIIFTYISLDSPPPPIIRTKNHGCHHFCLPPCSMSPIVTISGSPSTVTSFLNVLS